MLSTATVPLAWDEGRSTWETQPKLRLLLVGRNEPDRHEISWLLQDAGYLVIEASDGAEAAELLALDGFGGGYDLVIAQADLPGRSGIALARILADHAPSQPMLLLADDVGTILEGGQLKCGPRAVLANPATAERVLRAVRFLTA